VSNNASNTDEAAATTNAADAATALASEQGIISSNVSNVNSTLAEGNPFESKDYLTQQNLETSGAMNSADTAANQQLQSTAAKTGTNTAALANEEGSIARTGQRDLTQYNAGRDTANENTWLQEQQNLFSDQAKDASLEQGVYQTATSGQSSDLSSMTQADDAEDQMWASIAGDALQGAGVGAGLAARG
jgi:hypothetical protein